MSWEKKPLEAVADFCLGKMLDQKKNKGEFLPYLANVNVRWGSFDLDHLREMRFEHHELDRYGLNNGDIIMCEGGEPGRCALWKEQKPNMMIQKALHRIRSHECLSNKFLFYSLLHKGRTGHLAPLFTGTTIKHLPREKLAKVEIEVPPLEVQHRIVSILSAYDDLIENNRRRIHLLEQAARLLYKEWFIHLRFPGHEHTKIIDGVPEGWERKHLSDLVTTQYGFTETATNESIGPKFLRGTDINKTSYIDWSTVPFCPEDKLDFNKYALQVGDILVIRMADPGKVAIVESEEKAIFASYLVRFTQKTDNIPALYLFYALLDDAYRGFIAGASGGSTRKSASAKLLTDFNISVPPKHFTSLFIEKVYPLRQQIQILLRQNSRLREARDLLLPRLMNGEIAA